MSAEDTVICVYKPYGWTPLETLDRLRELKPGLADKRLSYAGRLDPMAEGVLPVLVGGANDARDTYLTLDKEYRFSFVLGIQTDSYDLLGLPTMVKRNVTIGLEHIEKIMYQTKQVERMPYPAYSAKTVHGKPLWWWAKQDRLDEVSIPDRAVSIDRLTLIDQSALQLSELVGTITKIVPTIGGDFRQEEIVTAWQALLTKEGDIRLLALAMTVQCGSGLYVRSLVEQMGKALGPGAVTTHILRTRVGDYILENCEQLT